MSRAHLFLSTDAVANLADLLAGIADVPGISQEYRYELEYCRGQVHPRMPAVEVLVLAGLLHEAPERLALDRVTRAAGRWWRAELARALTGPASGPQPRFESSSATRPTTEQRCTRVERLGDDRTTEGTWKDADRADRDRCG